MAAAAARWARIFGDYHWWDPEREQVQTPGATERGGFLSKAGHAQVTKEGPKP